MREIVNCLNRKPEVYIICNMKQCNITSRSLIIARLSESNTTIAKVASVQYLVYVYIISQFLLTVDYILV